MTDRTTRSTFEPSLQLHNLIKQQAMERGLMCYPMGGTIDGVHGNHILIAPPYIINENHIAEMVEKLGSAVDAAIAQALR